MNILHLLPLMPLEKLTYSFQKKCAKADFHETDKIKIKHEHELKTGNSLQTVSKFVCGYCCCFVLRVPAKNSNFKESPSWVFVQSLRFQMPVGTYSITLMHFVINLYFVWKFVEKFRLTNLWNRCQHFFKSHGKRLEEKSVTSKTIMVVGNIS